MNFRFRFYHIIPLVFIVIEIIFTILTSPQCAFDIDPEYAYFMNGLCISRGIPSLFHTDHPGTPLQLLIGLTITIVHLFSDKKLLIDALSNPEKYIFIIRIILVVINTGGVLLAGKYLFRYSQNRLKSAAVQLMVFSAVYAITAVTRLRPESLLIFESVLLVILCYRYISDIEGNNDKRLYPYLFALLIGASLATKISFAPYAIIPVLILKSWRKIITYGAVLLPVFLVFAFPILFRLRAFKYWVTGMITHNGLYGKGDKQIFDTEAFWTNLQIIFTKNAIFTFVFLALVITIILVVIYKRKLVVQNIKVRLIIAFFIAFCFQLILVAKHYKNYYMTPTNLFPVFITVLLTDLISDEFNLSDRLKKQWVPAIILIFFGAIAVSNIKDHYIIYKKNYLPRKETSEFLKDKHYKPILIAPCMYSSPFVEFPLNFGCVWTGNHRFTFYKRLKKIYPETVMLYPWTNEYQIWGDTIDAKDRIAAWDTFYVYKCNQSENIAKELNSGLNSDSTNYAIDRIFYNDETGESVDVYVRE